MSALQSVISTLVAAIGLAPILVAMVGIGIGILVMRWAAKPQAQSAERLPSFAKDYAKGLKATRTQLVHDDDQEWRAYADRK